MGAKNNSKFPRGVEVGCGAVIENEKGEILLARSTKFHNKWTLVGGHIEPGETVLQAMVREVKEELGLEVIALAVFAHGELIGSRDFYRPAHFVYANVYCKLLPGQSIKLDPDELSGYQWIKPTKALHLDLAESYRESIENFIKYRARQK